VDGGKILDIDVLDHLVIGGGRYVSLKERGLGFG
jgi:DNA repair protein RadC